MKLRLIYSILILSIALIYATETKSLGGKITLEETTAISSILENPSKYMNKKVLVEGTVEAVCQNKGCWMRVSGDKEGQSIMIKVEDDVIVFPKEGLSP